MGYLSFLEFLVLSSNNLSGELPSSLKNLSHIISLDLGDNELAGKLPAWLGASMSTMVILSLQSNCFTRNIPKLLHELSNLHILNLSQNKLSGQIPHCIGNLSGLKSQLTEKDIRYQGKLELVAKGRKLLYDNTLYLVNSLDLSNNSISGNIPLKLADLIELDTLNLSMNHLTGHIPAQIGELKQLETLDQSMNKLSSPIPSTMSSLTFLNYLNLSYNNLSGKSQPPISFRPLMTHQSTKAMLISAGSLYQQNVLEAAETLPVKTKKTKMEMYLGSGLRNQHTSKLFCWVLGSLWDFGYQGLVEKGLLWLHCRSEEPVRVNIWP